MLLQKETKIKLTLFILDSSISLYSFVANCDQNRRDLFAYKLLDFACKPLTARKSKHIHLAIHANRYSKSPYYYIFETVKGIYTRSIVDKRTIVRFSSPSFPKKQTGFLIISVVLKHFAFHKISILL